MRWVIIAATVLLVAFVALMLFGGDDSQRRSENEQIGIVQGMSGKAILRAITAPFAPEVALQPRRFEIPAGDTRSFPVPRQEDDRLSLPLRLVQGPAAVATFFCTVPREPDLCGQPLCLLRSGALPSGCDPDLPSDSEGSLVILEEGGTLRLHAPREAVIVEVP